jgi:aminopeptidase N
MNIGKYIHMQDEFEWRSRKIEFRIIMYLPQNKQGAERQFAQVKPMLECFEYWFGKYPFYTKMDLN